MVWKNEKGSALLIVLMVTTIVFIIGSALLALASVEKKIATNQTNEIKALNIAEAGVELAVSALKDNPNSVISTLQFKNFVKHPDYPETSNIFIGNSYPLNFGEGSVTSIVGKVFSAGDYSKEVDVKSTAKVKSSNKAVEVRVKIEMPPVLDFSQGFQAVTYDKDGASGDVDEVTIINDPNFPDLSNLKIAYQSMAAPLPNSITLSAKNPVLDLTLLPQMNNTVYYIQVDPSYSNNDLTIKGRYRGKGTIVVEGDLLFEDVLRYTGDSTQDVLTIINYGDIKDSGNGTVEALIYCNGTFRNTGTIDFTGGIIARTLEVRGNVTMDFDEAMVDNQPSGVPSSLKITAWQEKYN